MGYSAPLDAKSAPTFILCRPSPEIVETTRRWNKERGFSNWNKVSPELSPEHNLHKDSNVLSTFLSHEAQSETDIESKDILIAAIEPDSY